MSIEFDEFSKKSLGGTEIIKYELQKRIPKNLLDNFQIISERIDFLEKNKIRIFWTHLSPIQNEEMLKWLNVKDTKPLSNGGWKKFHKIIFISYSQMEEWVRRYDIPYSHCFVIKYALNPIEIVEKPKDKITIIYQSNPQRGLSILVNVFEKLSLQYSNIELKVHSSWKIYGLSEWQDNYEKSDLFHRLENHPKIHNIGYVDNNSLRESLSTSHIFAYPSIWKETFCLSLLEAMSARCLCVHSSLGALPETSCNWTNMYHFDEDIGKHQEKFFIELKKAIDSINLKKTQINLEKQKQYVDYMFNWEKRTEEWIDLLKDLKKQNNRKVNIFSYE